MKILFSADWHLKLKTKNIPDEWAINRYNILFEQLHTLSAKTDLHIIAGDIFDRLPSIQELELFFKFIKQVKVRTIIFSGNHEALKKNTTFLSYLKEVVNSINPLVLIVDDYYSEDNWDILPYNKLKEEDWLTKLNNKILFTHVRGEIPPHVKPEVDLDLFNKWEKVYAGDLHSNSNCQRNIFYPGSPVTTSFHRNKVETGVYIIDTETLTEKWIKLDVPQLIRKTISIGEELVPDEYDLVIYEVEGSVDELHKIEESSLLDKKISKRNTDTALILLPEMTIVEELVEYLKYIINIPEERIDVIIKEYYDTIKNS
jgi:DNA repair exonuclease SbcCD nuclease subunit